MSALRVSTYWPLMVWVKAEVASKVTAIRRNRCLRMETPGIFCLHNNSRLLFAGAAMAAASGRAAIPRLGQLAVRPDARLRHAAPEQPVIARGHRGVRIGPDVLALPVKSGTQSGTFSVESI